MSLLAFIKLYDFIKQKWIFLKKAKKTLIYSLLPYGKALMTKGLFICKLCCIILFWFALHSGNNSDNWHFFLWKEYLARCHHGFLLRKKCSCSFFPAFSSLYQNYSILMPWVCTERGMHPLEGVQDAASQPHHCEGVSVWRVGCTDKAHENLSLG